MDIADSFVFVSSAVYLIMRPCKQGHELCVEFMRRNMRMVVSAYQERNRDWKSGIEVICLSLIQGTKWVQL
jgi:hypothetical protein